MIPDISSFAKIENIPAALRGDYGSPLEMSKYIDFHEPGSSKDYDGRLYINNGTLVFDNTSTVYQLASVNDISNVSNGKVIWSKTSAGTATFTAPTSRNYTFVLIGGGGGGGPSNSLDRDQDYSIATPGGGGSGFVETAGAWLNAGQTISVSVGAGGAGGGWADDGEGAVGTNGGDTTVSINGTVHTARGGTRGEVKSIGTGRRNGSNAAWTVKIYGSYGPCAGGNGYEYPSNAEGPAMSGAGGCSGVVASMSWASHVNGGNGVDGAVYIV